ncbi:hypothetical protein DSM21852_36980 [Methylocystis bryophila]|nr:hypothetical protein DSM21852_36980 [Methylocystis bryophila]
MASKIHARKPRSNEAAGRYFMAKGRINKSNVDRLACPAGKSMEVLWDDALRGFGVVVLPSGRKTFIIQCKR